MRWRVKLVEGVGYDSGGVYKKTSDGKHTKIYRDWKNMLSRCYSENYLERSPTYVGCSVSEEWLDFQVYAAWHDKQIVSDLLSYDVDKDILVKGNKVYSEATCVMIPPELNYLLQNNKSTRGDTPVGVSFMKECGKYRATIKMHGKRRHLGRFTTPELAFAKYKLVKEEYIKFKANEYRNYISEEVYNIFMNWTIEYTD